MGFTNRVSFLLFLLLCVHLSLARKFFSENPQDFRLGIVAEEPDQPDETAYYQRLATSRLLKSEPDPDELDSHQSGWANKWTDRQVIAYEEPPKGGSDPQDFSLGVVAEEPPKGGSDPQDFGLGVVASEPDNPDEAAYYQNLAASHSIASEADPEQPDRRLP